MKSRAVVHLTPLAPRKGRPKLWAYSIPDLARLFGIPFGTVRQDIKRAKFDPADLVDIVRRWGELVVRAEASEKR